MMHLEDFGMPKAGMELEACMLNFVDKKRLVCASEVAIMLHFYLNSVFNMI